MIQHSPFAPPNQRDRRITVCRVHRVVSFAGGGRLTICSGMSSIWENGRTSQRGRWSARSRTHARRPDGPLCLSAYACGVTLPHKWRGESKLPGPTADLRCSLAIISGACLRVGGVSTTPRPSPGRGRTRQRSRQRAVPLPAHSCSTRPRRQSQSRVRTRYDQRAAKSGYATPCVVTAG